MTVEIRPVTAEELPAFWEVPSYVFALSRSSHQRWQQEGGEGSRVDPGWTLAAFVDGQLATSMAAYPFDVRLNGRPAPAAGVTMVGTYPEFRRRGLLRRLMVEALARYRDAGQSFALLWASYAAIYQRFGYGFAADHARYRFDPRFAAMRDESDPGGETRMLPVAEARPYAEQVRAAWVEPRNLVFDYTPEWWDRRLLDRDERRRFHAVTFNAAGEARGYLRYDTGEEFGGWDNPGPDQSMEIHDFYALDVEAHRALWRYVRSHDLVNEVRWDHPPPDDITPDLLLEPGVLQRATRDAQWMRITDVERVLGQRPYSDAGSLIISVRDELLTWNDGVYRLETDGPGAQVTRTSESADLVLPVASLATLVSGARSASHLARAGMLEGDAAAIRRADRLFATDYAPHTTDLF